jgi:TP901 family phage tail tape measure protein
MSDEIATLQIRVLSTEVEQANRRLAALEQQSEGAERSVRRLGNSSRSLTFGAIASGVVAMAGLTAATGSAVKQWLAYDKAMKEVLSISTMNRTEFRAMRDDILQLSVAMGVDATVAAKGLYQALSAGIPKENAMAFMKVAADAAIGGVTTVEVAVDGLTNVINAYKLPVADAAVVTDKLFAAVVDGKTTFEELSRNMSKTTVTAAAMGVPLDQVLASIIAITQQGTPTTEAFTQITAALKALLDPADEMKVAFKEMNVESGRQAVAQYGLAGALQEVRNRFEGQDASLVKAMRGTEAYNAILSMTGENLGLYNKGLKSVEESAGKTAKAVGDNANTLETAIAGLKSTFVGFVEAMENSWGIISGTTALIKEFTAAIAQANKDGGFFSTGIEQKTRIARETGGVVGVKQLRDEIASLKQQRDAMQAEGVTLSDYDPNATAKNWLTSKGGNQMKLAAIIDDLAKATTALNEFDQEVRDTADLYDQLGEAVKNDDQQRADSLREEINALQEKGKSAVKAAEDAKKAELETAEEAKKERLAKVKAADELLAKEEAEAKAKKKADEEHKKNMDQLAEDAVRLATTERERLELQIKNLEVLKQQRPEMAATADEAISAVKKQLELYNKTHDAEGERIKKALAVDEDMLERKKQRHIEVAKEIAQSEYEIALEAQTKLATAIQQSLIGQHQFTLNSFSDFFGNLSQLSNFHSEKAFKVGQAFAIAQATVQMFQSAVGAYAQGSAISPFLGPVFAAAALAAGAGNIASIKSQKFTAYEQGGMIPAGQYGLVGEAGPEFIRGPAVVTSARASQGLMAGKDRAETNFRVVINNAPGHTADVTESRDQDGALMEITITRTIDRLTAEATNGGGRFVPALASRFNLRRNGNQR